MKHQDCVIMCLGVKSTEKGYMSGISQISTTLINMIFIYGISL